MLRRLEQHDSPFFKTWFPEAFQIIVLRTKLHIKKSYLLGNHASAAGRLWKEPLTRQPRKSTCTASWGTVGSKELEAISPKKTTLTSGDATDTEGR